MLRQLCFSLGFLVAASGSALAQVETYPTPTVETVAEGYRPLVYENQKWNGSEWAPSSRVAYGYDGAGRRAEDVEQRWNEGVWVNERRRTSAYDTDMLTEVTTQTWTESAWANEGRESYAYDETGRLSGHVTQTWDGSSWVNAIRLAYGYAEAERRTDIVDQRWTGEWVNAHRYLAVYDENGNVTQRTYQNWRGEGWDDGFRVVSTYDGEGRLSRVVHGDSTLGSALRTLYTYDGKGPVAETVGQTWNGEAWVDGNYQAFSYDEAERLVEFVIRVRWIYEGGEAWRDVYRATYGYDGAGNVTEHVVQERWSGETWTNVARAVTTYEFATTAEGAPTVEAAVEVAPNPSAGRAVIAFEVPTPQPVRVAVYDGLGREVAVLADGPLPASRHTVPLNRTLPAGVYVVRVAGATFVGSRTVTVVR